jgi:multidrug efflux pump subunit AcrA (membrane-fusion protein)
MITMRKVLLVILGIIILGGASYIAFLLINAPKEANKANKNIYKPIAIDTITNSDIPIVVKTNGVAEALKKFELFSEVQGVFQYSSKDFRAGQTYDKGQILLKINNEEFMANVISAKSDFFNLLVALMPDIKIDYPNEFEQWQTYINEFDVQEPLQQLPEPSKQLKYFITGRGILSSYFNIKNLETRLNKFTIRAPFDGVLTEATINLGTLVRPGQRLGEFISPSVYEIQIALQKSMIPYLSVGDSVQLKSLDANFLALGKISRINKQIDAQTQTIQVFVQTKDQNVKEGLYLQAEIEGQTIQNAYSINRSLLNNANQVFVVKDSILDYRTVTPIYFTEDKALVKGLNDGETIMTSNLSSAYPGMLVRPKN